MSSGNKTEQHRLSRKSSKASIETMSSDISRPPSRSSVTLRETPASGGSKTLSMKSTGSIESLQVDQSSQMITSTSSVRPRPRRFKAQYKSTHEAYNRLPAAEREAVFVEVTFFTDPSQKEVTLKPGSLFVPQQHPFKLQKATPAYEYAERVARASLADHAKQGIIKAGRTYAWLPLLFKVKTVVRKNAWYQTLAGIESIPVVYDNKWC